ncbi:50S ribosomal protein L3 [Blochmannia endosymbiont of Colobopsis nipponica]|uniref:50S ribosomal protein L3 n=1 Tax=Blochmannia endosymbiont of Colobopsis nipponica TaxID=2681987 RepID=UPI0017855434|nr:50S ribosomal protein L3 [Blochmannia endosymbiont of Colobopsis nipponica]QOI11223.1 50S ribosomal protein L3 [Blochmannia endosymbiont of Colobopsis nipponica]
MYGLVGKKLGMTRIFNENGVVTPVTVVYVEPNSVTQIKNLHSDGYFAIQFTTGSRKKSRLNKAELGHFLKAGVKAGRGLWEFRISEKEILNVKVGQKFNVESFMSIKRVDVTGISKGKGFAGVIKRWNFHSQDASHGNSLSHRAPGSIGQNQTPGKVFKGKKMPGQLGNKKNTVQSLDLVRVDLVRNLLLIKGSIPGSIGNDILIKPSIR